MKGEQETKVENNTPTAEEYQALKAELEAEKRPSQVVRFVLFDDQE